MTSSLDTQTARSSRKASEKIAESLYVAVPAGDFLMGCEQGRDEERPVHRVWVEAFEMAIYQVRHRDFAAFLEASGHPAPPRLSSTRITGFGWFARSGERV